MRSGRLLVGLALMLFGLGSNPSLAQGVRWQPTLDAAKRIAGQTNRLVLVHFWSDGCKPCAQMDQTVFSRPDVAAALDDHFVLVKVHRESFPYTASQFGVAAVPTDVILTPQGQMLDRLVGATDVNTYMARVMQVASSYRAQTGLAVAQGPRPAAPQPVPMAPVGYAPPQPPVPRVSAVPPDPAPPMASAPPYGAQGALGQSPGPDVWPQGPAAAPPPPQGVPGPPVPAPPVSAAPVPAPPMSAPLGASPALSAQAPNVELPPGSWPLGLEGYCPVSLTEKERWVLGNRRWGVQHEGRTYLFAGPDEQRRFLENPNRYAPVLAGHDVVVAAEQGQMVPGRREYGGWFQGRVYLFASEQSFRKFDADPQRYAAAVGTLLVSQHAR